MPNTLISQRMTCVRASCISAHDDDQASIWTDHSVLTRRSDLSAERNRVDSIMMSNEFDTPFHYEDVAICWAFSLDSRSFSPSPPSILLTLALSVSFRRPVGPPRCSADSLVPTIVAPRSLSLSIFLILSGRSLSGSLSWTGSCNERLRRQTRRLVSHRGERWRYFGNITAGYPGR